MRLIHLPLIAVLSAAPLIACSASASSEDGKPGVAATGSGNERHYAIADFDTVGLAAGGDVEVRVGPGFSVIATAAPETLDKIKVERDGHALKLGWRNGVHWGGNDKVRYTVTMPRIAGADIGGSGTITVDRVEGGTFEGNIGGSGTLDLRGVRLDKAVFSIGGSGDVVAAGAARALEVNIGGSGDVRALPLRAQTADISIAGAGKVRATVTRAAKVTIVGSGDVTIGGGATCSVTKMGSGTVDCG